MEEQVPRVVIGMDPHKRSVTIEVMLADESVVDGGRFDTTVEGYDAMLEHVAAIHDPFVHRVAMSDVPSSARHERATVRTAYRRQWRPCTFSSRPAHRSRSRCC